MDGIIRIFTIFGLLYILSFSAMLYLSHRAKGPMIVPGDIYQRRGGRTLYLPTGGALILAIILYIVISAFLPES